jgi:hypothetical protein
MREADAHRFKRPEVNLPHFHLLPILQLEQIWGLSMICSLAMRAIGAVMEIMWASLVVV